MAVQFLTGILTLALGYAYPAYKCFKALEQNKPRIEDLRFWCQYWILLAFLTVFERFADFTIAWLPMYGEAKLALIVYLWHPKTRGAQHVYDSYMQPYLAKHETEVDRNLLELRTRAKDVAASHLQKALVFGQASFLEVARYVSSQVQATRSRQSTVQEPEQDQRREEDQETHEKS